MILQLSPGSKSSGEAPEGYTIPVSQTLPNVNFDEILASLDTDTRASCSCRSGARRTASTARAAGCRAR